MVEDTLIVLAVKCPFVATVDIEGAGSESLSGVLAVEAARDAAGDSGGRACK